MDQTRKALLRAVATLRHQYIARRKQRRSRQVPDVKAEVRRFSQRMLREEHLLQMALRRGFERASEILRHRYVRALEEVRSILDSQCQQYKQRDTPVPSPRDLFEELVATEQEFGRIEVSARQQRISVTTEPIRLEGIHLGRFRIDLLVDSMQRTDPLLWFRVEATDPNPAASNADVTHPHVNNGQLCPGDAIRPIEQALQEGRISEFFTLVRAVLTTYNAESPFVPLNEWEGQACEDCGYVVSDEHAFYCEGCEGVYCDECVRCCEVCGTPLCRGCLLRSEISDVWVCSDCAVRCEDCGATCTNEELTDGLCTACGEARQPENVNKETNNGTHNTH